MPVAYTSRLALKEISEDLGRQSRRVYEAIRLWPHKTMGPCIRDLAEALELETATISGRVNDLRAADAIKDGPIKLDPRTAKRVKTYIAFAWREPKPWEVAQIELL
ncbi:MAG TPA: hypothetical protein VK961_06925 [Chthoniobacter sp.]|nr:hypothetical protein [Chthoniobacter sp.]